MKCLKCGSDTWDNRAKKASGEYSAKGPDFTCQDKSCKFKKTKMGWDVSDYQTGFWAPKDDNISEQFKKPAEQSNAPAPKKEPVNWDKIGWGKCKHAFLLIQMQNGKALNIAEPVAEDWADASMREMPKRETTKEKPKIGYKDEEVPEITDEDIPFS